ncbi:thioredoxin [Alkalihalobacillus deserti]|uniref:thioredoxin n=1 Tax=Alkalihalobacillus deserti TaxID=2879466 RepID=UPI001D13C97A|nr:thioredoxin [Alkalihalobacillus deserti]
MDKYIELMIISSIFLLSSCFSTATSIEHPLLKHDEETITVLFSDSSKMQEEKTYYDALLELKQTYPNNIPSLLIIDAKDRDLVRYFNIEQFPTMLVLTGEQEDLRMEGIFSKDEILAHLVETFHLEKETKLSYSFFSDTVLQLYTYKKPVFY